ncbi:NPRL3 isoform 11 [Pan troglodytes]|uniref:NPR3 like, GATOR1 complex subunit n=2 Tax=Homininae TaxID=207598 RepID=F8WBJ1_HUMAN|nr:NPR3 like, GATOR1 complex subunit [Homo sapiens]KAI4052486.1 NPR3 like, GATOR1 complex subunit [Homo sapiens]PNI12026.1 NPRL3 isoform 11 [Pan troglodytes]
MRDNTSPISVILVSRVADTLPATRATMLMSRTAIPGFQMLFWQQFWQPSLKCVAKNLN